MNKLLLIHTQLHKYNLFNLIDYYNFIMYLWIAIPHQPKTHTHISSHFSGFKIENKCEINQIDANSIG